jgi:hypothetical protein
MGAGFPGSVSCVNCTFTANTAQGGDGGPGADGGEGDGGAFFNLGGSLTLHDVTVAKNTIAAGKGGTGQKHGGAVYSLAYGNNIITSGAAVIATLTLDNNILSNTIGGSDFYNTVGALGNNANQANVAGSSNLVQNPELTGAIPPGVITIVGFDPALGPLQDNGGPTPTMAILRTSPAFGGGNINVPDLPTTDQTGRPRVVSGRLDLGAFQYQGTLSHAKWKRVARFSPASRQEQRPGAMARVPVPMPTKVGLISRLQTYRKRLDKTPDLAAVVPASDRLAVAVRACIVGAARPRERERALPSD